MITELLSRFLLADKTAPDPETLDRLLEIDGEIRHAKAQLSDLSRVVEEYKSVWPEPGWWRGC